MKRKLIALDMDGTVLDNNREIPAENIKAIREAQAAGHVVMICSGRPHDSLLTFLASYGLADLPISAANGSITIIDGQIIDRVTMNLAKVEQLVNWMDEREYPFNIFTDTEVRRHSEFLSRSQRELLANPEQAAAMAKRGLDYDGLVTYMERVAPNLFTTWADFSADVGIVKIFAITPDQSKKVDLEEFAATIGQLTITSSFPDNVEISDINGHKGTGIVVVANHLGIPIEDTVAIGDNFNDLGMFEVAGLTIAMGNAEPEIIELCDVITFPNTEFGVAHAIREYVL